MNEYVIKIPRIYKEKKEQKSLLSILQMHIFNYGVNTIRGLISVLKCCIRCDKNEKWHTQLLCLYIY